MWDSSVFSQATVAEYSLYMDKNTGRTGRACW